MKRETIEAMWNKAIGEALQVSPDDYGVRDLNEELTQAAVGFAKLLLFEAAKTICVECKINGPSEPTRDPLNRVHVHHGAKDYTVRNACRAVAFYLEEESPATS